MKTARNERQLGMTYQKKRRTHGTGDRAVGDKSLYFTLQKNIFARSSMTIDTTYQPGIDVDVVVIGTHSACGDGHGVVMQ